MVLARQPDVLDQLIAALQATREGKVALANRATPSVPQPPNYTGPNSLFGVLGLERDIISSRVQPYGLADRLPAIGTNIMWPQFAYWTGFDPVTGALPNGVCDDPQTVGPSSTCFQTAQFGRYSFQTRTLEVNALGQQINRGEFQDLRFFNDPLAGGVGGITMPASIPNRVNIANEVLMRQIELGSAFQQKLARQIYEGNPANNTGGGGYREFAGLDMLIGTGKRDAFTQVLCSTLDSDIKNFNNMRLDNAAAGQQIITMLSYMMRFLRMKADSTNMSPVTWAFVMRPSLFWELTAIWACNYMTFRCAFGGNAQAQVNVDGGDMIAMRDAMRNGRYIIIDGERYEVILDNVIREDTNVNTAGIPAGVFASDIYIIPFTARGRPVTYWEYFDFTTSMSELGAVNNASNYYWSDGGRYMWHLKPPVNWCLQWMAKIEPRIILRTPHLAGRLLNVAYAPLQHEVDPINTDPYFQTGGSNVGRPVQKLYGEWGVVS